MIKITDFGEKARLYCLRNQNGMEVTVTDFGARIVDILLPVEEGGKLRNVSLSAQSDKHYRDTDLYPGSTILPVAGRISQAQAEISGTIYHFTENEPGRTLHGGVDTANQQYWEVVLDEEGQKVIFELLLADGFNGFPGNIKVRAIYQLTDQNELKVDYEAVSDKDTLFNPTNHVYFNLTGDFQKSVENHQLKIEADYYAPLGTDNMPTGKLEDVSGTPFDFRTFSPFSQGFDGQHPQNQLVKGYDHPWLLKDVATPVEVISPDDKVKVTVRTNQASVVIYTYNFPVEELATYHGAFSLECQALPNACNIEGFGSILLQKDEAFSSQTVYQFDW